MSKYRSMLKRLLIRLGLAQDVGAPVHVGANPVYFVSVSEQDGGWVWSWRTPDHSRGEVSAAYKDHNLVLGLMGTWVMDRRTKEHARFVFSN